MLFYAGGNFLNPSAPGYSIWLNSWSDLGRTVAWSGKTNLLALTFFSVAMVGWVISFIPSIYALVPFFSKSPHGKLLSKVGTIFAVICAVCLFFDVLLPLDIHPIPHNIIAVLGYLALIGVELSFAYLMFSDKNYPNKHAICFSAVAAAVIIYLTSNIFFNVAILQKTISITIIMATLIVFYDSWKATR